MDKLYFEAPSLSRKEDAINYIQEHLDYGSEINGAGGLHYYLNNYEGWLEQIKFDRSVKPSAFKVPTETFFLVRESDKMIIGMINIRLVLNETLSKLGGHIGYGIRPTERRKGYNKINLYLGLKECQRHGIKEAFLDCDAKNTGSWKTMEALGGRFVREYYENQYYHINIKDYLFDVDKCIEEHKDEYEDKIKENV